MLFFLGLGFILIGLSIQYLNRPAKVYDHTKGRSERGEVLPEKPWPRR